VTDQPEHPPRPTVDFGAEQVTPEEKTRRVAGVFSTVAPRYDVMNDLMSLGLHRVLKRISIEMSGARPGHRVLDLAGGTGDLTALYARTVGRSGRVVLADINAAMLVVGRDRLFDAGIANVSFSQADAEALPFPDDCFHCVSIGFGLRNVTDKDRALIEMQRVLRPGGRLVVLEFSKPTHPLIGSAYAAFQRLWPPVGRLVTGEAAPYRYLVESIQRHPEQKVLKLMMCDAGFEDVAYENLLGGIVAIHHARKRLNVPLETHAPAVR
jgi:demethylmenaquinone methyltransferase / 2-methoxy-6-polyprenyl-1,4-benzoquinol methylase